MQNTYLWINFFTVIFPFLLSFDNKVAFYKQWNSIIPAIIITAIIFIVWDIIFTSLKIWWFNPLYVKGINIINLPLEEILFFIAIPYAGLFLYEVFNSYIKKDIFVKRSKEISIVISIIFLIIALINFSKIYTFYSFLFSALYTVLLALVFKVKYLSRFFFTYLVLLIPFLLVNGMLTGSFLNREIVQYNNLENLGIRLLTIPIEDISYGYLLMLINISLHEKIKSYFLTK